LHAALNALTAIVAGCCRLRARWIGTRRLGRAMVL
jgi:hypothetical protein